MNAVPRAFPNATIVCLGSGPSLTRADVDYCRGRAVTIAIKETVRLAPWADVFYACDKKFFEHHGDELVTFAGLRFTLDHMAHRWATDLQIGDHTGLSLDPTTLNTGYSSGFQCINLSVLLGAVRVLLLGYDCQVRNDGPDHWFGSHAWKTRPPVDLFRPCFSTLVEPLKQVGVSVINCSRETALDCFPRMPLREALA